MLLPLLGLGVLAVGVLLVDGLERDSPVVLVGGGTEQELVLHVLLVLHVRPSERDRARLRTQEVSELVLLSSIDEQVLAHDVVE